MFGNKHIQNDRNDQNELKFKFKVKLKLKLRSKINWLNFSQKENHSEHSHIWNGRHSMLVDLNLVAKGQMKTVGLQKKKKINRSVVEMVEKRMSISNYCSAQFHTFCASSKDERAKREILVLRPTQERTHTHTKTS